MGSRLRANERRLQVNLSARGRDTRAVSQHICSASPRTVNTPMAHIHMTSSVTMLLREALAKQRLAGAHFSCAWRVATAEALTGQRDQASWREVLKATKPTWQAAYYYDSPSRLERAVSTLAVADSD